MYADKYESNHTGEGQTDRQTITEVISVKIYEFVQLNVVNSGVKKRPTIMTQVIIDTF